MVSLYGQYIRLLFNLHNSHDALVRDVVVHDELEKHDGRELYDIPE